MTRESWTSESECVQGEIVRPTNALLGRVRYASRDKCTFKFINPVVSCTFPQHSYLGVPVGHRTRARGPVKKKSKKEDLGRRSSRLI